MWRGSLEKELVGKSGRLREGRLQVAGCRLLDVVELRVGVASTSRPLQEQGPPLGVRPCWLPRIASPRSR